MSNLLTVLGLGVSSNLDTLGVGLAYGTRKFRLTFLSNFVCALIPCIGTYLMMVLGAAVRNIIPDQLANDLGAGIIILAGLVLIIQYLKRPPMTKKAVPRQTPLSPLKRLRNIMDDPFQVDYDYSGSIEFKEAMILATALTLNNLSCGFAAGLIGLNIFMLVGASFIISLLFFYSGIKIGLYYIARWFGERGDLVAGVILVLLGLYELLG